MRSPWEGEPLPLDGVHDLPDVRFQLSDARLQLGFARLVTRAVRRRMSWWSAGDEQEAVEQISGDFPHLPVVR